MAAVICLFCVSLPWAFISCSLYEGRIFHFEWLDMSSDQQWVSAHCPCCVHPWAQREEVWQIHKCALVLIQNSHNINNSLFLSGNCHSIWECKVLNIRSALIKLFLWNTNCKSRTGQSVKLNFYEKSLELPWTFSDTSNVGSHCSKLFAHSYSLYT